MTVRGFLSFGGSEIPSKAVDDFRGLRPYVRESRRTPTPSLHAASIRFPVSLKPARPFISSRAAGSGVCHRITDALQDLLLLTLRNAKGGSDKGAQSFSRQPCLPPHETDSGGIVLVTFVNR